MPAPDLDASYTVSPIGWVEKADGPVRLHILEEYAPALKGIEGFSHVVVLWWFHENDTPEGRNTLQVRPRRNPDNPLTGIFACRAPCRPNLIALDVCRILAVRGTVVDVDKTHAWDGTPILDLKPYIPNMDDPAEAAEVRLPDWLND